LLAIGTQLAYLLILDYIIVLELLRLLLLRGDRESEGPRPRWIRAVLPYVLVALGFVAARIVLHNPGYRNNPATELGRWADPSRVLALGPSLVDSVLESAVFAWSYPAWLVVEEGSARLVGVALLVGGLAAALVGVRGWGARKPADSERGLRPFIVIGVATLVAVCLLMAVLHRCVALGNVMNRYAYPPAVGCCLFAIGVMSYLPRRLFVLAVAVLVGSASAANVRNANDYRVAWRRQRAIYWQLAWRAPEIWPETTVVLLSPLKEQHSNHTALTGALNLAYTAPRERPLLGLGHDDETQAWMESGDGAAFLAREPFWVWTLTPRAGPRDGFNHFLALYLDPVSSTLRVLDSKHLEELPARAGLAHSAARFSSQDRITGSGPRGIPTRQLFGPEPAHDWRWYFQRAELARQSGQFGEAAQLGREVLKRDFSTPEPSEWLVFIEAAIRSQDEATARAALRRGLASADRPSLRGFSRTLAKLALDLPSPGRELALQLEAQVDEETSELDRLGTPGRLSESRNHEER
ncbi:MAG TPA: hypothetical protein VJY33_23550, partial [Isosphaeraceae bacterium]|nr:hypothetical protein [Isosphaeraceae bacterium]